MVTITPPLRMLLVGFCLLTVGFVLPLLMVMQLIESTIFLNFFAFTATVAGSIVGLIGAATLVGLRR